MWRRSSTPPPWAAWPPAFAPLVAEALAARDLSGGATRIEWVPHGVVAAVLPFNWPVSVMGNKVLPALLAGDTVVVKAPPTCPGRRAPRGRGDGRGRCRPAS